MTIEDYAQLVSVTFQREFAGKALHNSGEDSMFCIDSLHNATMVDLLHHHQNGNREEVEKQIKKIIFFTLSYAQLNSYDVGKIIKTSAEIMKSKTTAAPKPQPKKKKWN